MPAAPRAASAWLSEAAAGAAGTGGLARTARVHCTVIARLVRSEDFERVLRTRSWAHSAHFAVHHLPVQPSVPRRRVPQADPAELSTSDEQSCAMPVDDSPAAAPPDTVWLGAVVPKRHARRAVTRTLVKRQIRAAMARHARAMPAGLWVVRLRAPFERATFVSAASVPLKRAVRAELERLIASASSPVDRVHA
jgi:ribonuclease P protein component